MKRALFLLSFLAVTLAFVGCQNENITENEGKDIIFANGKTILKVTMAETRTYMGEKQGDIYPTYWESDDQLCVNNTLSSKITVNPNNPSSAEFEFDGRTYKSLGIMNVLHAIEDILYGTDDTEARLILPQELPALYRYYRYILDSDGDTLLDSTGEPLMSSVYD